MKKTFGLVVAVAFALAVPASANQAINWGTGFDDFRDTCLEIGGIRNGNGFGATCAFDGGVERVAAGSPGWTVDVAYATVATWLGGAVVDEEQGEGVVVACYNPGGRQMSLSHQHCVVGQ